MMMTWGDNRTEASIPCKVNIARVIGSRNAIDLGMVKDNTEYHLAMVCSHESDGSWLVTFYLQDAATGKTLNKVRINTKGKGWSLEQQGMLNCWLGHSQWEPDQDANASYNEVRVWATALTEEQLTKSARRGPDAFITPNSLSLW